MTEKKADETPTPVEDKSPLDSRTERLRVLSEGLPEYLRSVMKTFYEMLDDQPIPVGGWRRLPLDVVTFDLGPGFVRDALLAYVKEDADQRGLHVWFLEVLGGLKITWEDLRRG